MNVSKIDLENLHYHTSKIIRFYKDVRSNLIDLDITNIRNLSLDDLNEESNKCSDIFINMSEKINIKKSYDVAKSFISTACLYKPLEMANISYEFAPNFHRFSYDFLLKMVSYRAPMRGRFLESLIKEEIQKSELRLCKHEIYDYELTCNIIYCFIYYLAKENTVTFIENELSFLINYKNKLVELLGMVDNLSFIKYINPRYNYEDTPFNLISIEREINLLKNRLVTKRKDKTILERLLISDILRFLIVNDKKNILPVINLISSSPLIENFIDSRTIYRLYKSNREMLDIRDKIIKEAKTKLRRN